MRRTWHDIANHRIAAALFVLCSLPLRSAPLLHIPWEGLSMVTGKTVSIAMPGGAVITGKAIGVESEALLVDVKTTTGPKAYPTAPLRVPRATLHRLEMQTKGKFFRIIGTVGGAGAGAILGTAVAVAIDWRGGHDGAAVATACGVTAAGAIGGYFAGNGRDRGWTAIEIVP